MADFNKIDKARKILGLDEYATFDEIKKAYREKAQDHHPDSARSDKKDQESIKEINTAKDILLAYCKNYKYSFKEKDVKRNSLDKEFYKHLKQFYDGWWSDLGF